MIPNKIINNILGTNTITDHTSKNYVNDKERAYVMAEFEDYHGRPAKSYKEANAWFNNTYY